MLLLVTGGAGSGKSAYALQWAASLGREAIRLSCPPFPDMAPAGGHDEIIPARPGFSLTEMLADAALSETLQVINRGSNIFRADNRVLIVDSLSGWLRAHIREVKAAGGKPDSAGFDGPGSFRELVRTIQAFEGKRIVVSEEAAAGLADDPWERWYTYELASGLRQLADDCGALYRLTAGVAVEWKGHRVKRGKPKHEYLYPNRR